MRRNESQGSDKIVLAVVAVVLAGFALYGVVTGDLSSRRTGELTRTSNPLFFWAYIAAFAAAGVYAALVALGVVVMPAPRKISAEAARRADQRETAQKLTLLALLGSGGSAYAWWSERSIVSPSVMNEIMGWLALAFLGLAAWPRLLPPGPIRTVLRIAGATAVLVAALAILRLTR